MSNIKKSIMPPRRIQYLSKVLEILVLGTTLALFSHVSVNFCERYVIQKELGKMKSNLQVLKSTVNNIGGIYTDLFTEVQCLGDKKACNAKKLPTNDQNNKNEIVETKSKVHQLLEDLGIGVDVQPETYEFGIEVKPQTSDICIDAEQQDIDFDASPKLCTDNIKTKNKRKKIFRNSSKFEIPSFLVRKGTNPKSFLLKTISFPDYTDADTHTHNHIEIYTMEKPYDVFETGKRLKSDPTNPNDPEHYNIYSKF